MVELFFITCLSTAPEVCQPRRLLFEEQNGLFSCVLQAQNELARWVAAHPDETVREWKCRFAGEEGKHA